MGFLSGWFIAGLAAISAPIIFHMIRRTPSGRIPFSTLMFLRPSPPRITRRSRIDQWPLLLLRALALTLLALAFARPFLRSVQNDTTPTAPGRQIAVVVDTSASMQRAGMWEDAKLKVVEAFASATAEDQLALYAFDRTSRVIVSFQEWKELTPSTRRQVVADRLEKLKPTWASTDLGNALILAAEDIESLEMERDDKSGDRADNLVVLISDLQKGSAVAALQNYEWPETTALAVEPVDTDARTNAGLELMVQSELESRDVRLRVRNSAESNAEQFTVKWVDRAGRVLRDSTPVYVAPGRSRTVTFEPPTSATQSRIVLSGDSHEFDNTLYVDQMDAARHSILYLGSEEESDPESLRFYLARAFPDTPSRTVRMLPPPEGPTATMDPSLSMVVAIDRVDTRGLPGLKAYAEAGGTILFVAQSADGVSTIGPLLGDASVSASEAEVSGYSMITQVDFDHPMFAPFADAQFADFTRIHVWRHRSVPTSALKDVRVLATFDDDDAAVIEKPIGHGRLVLFTFGWQPEDSQLALSTKFVPLMNCLLELGGNAPASLPRMTVGDRLELEPVVGADFSGRVSVTQPSGSVVELASDASVFDATTEPGVYRMAVGPRVSQFAVNVAPAESDTSVMPLESLESLGVRMDRDSRDPANVAAAEDLKRQLKIQELEKQQKLWRWLVFAAIGTLFVETWLAGRIAARRAPVADEAGPGGTS